MTFWDFFNAHFIPMFSFLCIFSGLLLLLLYLVFTRAKIGLTKDGKWFYNYSPFSTKKQNAFLERLIEDYKMDAFKKSYFDENTNSMIGICENAITDLKEYFEQNDMTKSDIQKKYEIDEKFKIEYDKKKQDFMFWKSELNELKNRQWHGEFCGDFAKFIEKYVDKFSR